VTYPPDEFPLAYLYAFSGVEEAQEFVLSYRDVNGDADLSSFEIWKADGDVVEGEYPAAVLVDEEAMREFWLYGFSSWDQFHYATMPAPPGSVWCKSIELISKVD
jgi:hypothetical protein